MASMAEALAAQQQQNTQAPQGDVTTNGTPASVNTSIGSNSLQQAPQTMASALTPQASVATSQAAPAAATSTLTPGQQQAVNQANNSAVAAAAVPSAPITQPKVSQSASYNGQQTPTTADFYNSYSASNNPLMQQTEAAARRQAAASGLANTSMAVSAAQGAGQQVAYDMAKTDAAASQQQSQYNQSLKQQESEFSRNLALQKTQIENQAKQFAQSIQANARGAYTDAVNNLLNNSSVNINNISSNANIGKADKDKLIAQEIKNRDNDLKYLQSLYGTLNTWSDRL